MAAAGIAQGYLWHLQAYLELELGNRRARAAFRDRLEVRVAGMTVGQAFRWDGDVFAPLRPIAESLGWIVHWEKGLEGVELSRDGDAFRLGARSIFGEDYLSLSELERLLALPPSRVAGDLLLVGEDLPDGAAVGAGEATPAELWLDRRRLSRQALVLADGQVLVPARPLALALGAIFRLQAPAREVEVNYHRLPAHVCSGRVCAELDPFLAIAGSQEVPVAVRPGEASPLPVPPSPIRRVAGRPDRVALTFDDYLTPVTAGLLDVLEAREVRATFFVIGASVEQHPDLARRIAAGGSELANHTWSHRHPFTLSEDDLRAEILATDLAIRRHAGPPAPFFRPPGGYRCPLTLAVAADLGLRTVLWSLNAGDANRAASPEWIASTVLARAHPGAVVVLHMTRPATVQALPAIIDGLRARGLEPVPLGELLDHHPDRRSPAGRGD